MSSIQTHRHDFAHMEQLESLLRAYRHAFTPALRYHRSPAQQSEAVRQFKSAALKCCAQVMEAAGTIYPDVADEARAT